MLPERCQAILTAAGLSSRMGFPKALLDWHRRPLIEHQITVLHRLARVVVVLGHDARRIRVVTSFPPRAVVVDNPDYEQGRAASIRRGLQEIGPDAEAILVCGVDQPLDPGAIDALLAAFDPAVHAYAVPVHNGRRGHPVVFSARLRGELEQISEATEGLRVVVRRHRADSLEVPVAAPEVLFDLNTPEAADAAQEELN